MNFTDEELEILRYALYRPIDSYMLDVYTVCNTNKIREKLLDAINQEIKDREFEKTKEL